jgi:hypothetical protein
VKTGTAIHLVLPNRWKTDASDQDSYVLVPGIVVGEPVAATFTTRSGATVQSPTVEVLTLRDTTASNPDGGRRWYQVTTERTSNLVRRFEAVTGLDIDGAGQPIPAATLWTHVAESIVDFRRRQAAARKIASPQVAERQPAIRPTRAKASAA